MIQIWIATFGFKFFFDCQNYCYLISDFQKLWLNLDDTYYLLDLNFKFLRWFSNWHFQISYTFLTLLIIILSWYFLILPTYTFLIPPKIYFTWSRFTLSEIFICNLKTTKIITRQQQNINWNDLQTLTSNFTSENWTWWRWSMFLFANGKIMFWSLT